MDTKPQPSQSVSIIKNLKYSNYFRRIIEHTWLFILIFLICTLIAREVRIIYFIAFSPITIRILAGCFYARYFISEVVLNGEIVSITYFKYFRKYQVITNWNDISINIQARPNFNTSRLAMKLTINKTYKLTQFESEGWTIQDFVDLQKKTSAGLQNNWYVKKYK